MEVNGTVNIATNIEYAEKVDVSSQFAPSQTNIQTNTTTTLQSSENTENDSSHIKDSISIKRNPNIPKIGFLRVVNSMFAFGFFKTASGAPISKRTSSLLLARCSEKTCQTIQITY
jgi:hypothetical protein